MTIRMTIKVDDRMTIKVFGFSSTNVQLLNTEILQSDSFQKQLTRRGQLAVWLIQQTGHRPDIPLMLYTAYKLHSLQATQLTQAT